MALTQDVMTKLFSLMNEFPGVKIAEENPDYSGFYVQVPTPGSETSPEKIAELQSSIVEALKGSGISSATARTVEPHGFGLYAHAGVAVEPGQLDLARLAFSDLVTMFKNVQSVLKNASETPVAPEPVKTAAPVVETEQGAPAKAAPSNLVQQAKLALSKFDHVQIGETEPGMVAAAGGGRIISLKFPAGTNVTDANIRHYATAMQAVLGDSGVTAEYDISRAIEGNEKGSQRVDFHLTADQLKAAWLAFETVKAPVAVKQAATVKSEAPDEAAQKVEAETPSQQQPVSKPKQVPLYDPRLETQARALARQMAASQKLRQEAADARKWQKAEVVAEEFRQQNIERRKNRPVDRIDPVVGQSFSKGQPDLPKTGLNSSAPFVTNYGFDASGINFGPVKRNRKTGLYLDDAGLVMAQEAFGYDPDLLVRITHHAVSKEYGRDTFRFDSGEVVQAVHYQTPEGRGAMSHLAFQTDKIDAGSGDIILDKLAAEGHSIDKIEIGGTPAFKKNAEHAIALEKTRRKNQLVSELKALQKNEVFTIDEAKLLVAVKQAVKDGKVPTSVVTKMLREELVAKNSIGKKSSPSVIKLAEMAGVSVPASMLAQDAAAPKAGDDVKRFVRNPGLAA